MEPRNDALERGEDRKDSPPDQSGHKAAIPAKTPVTENALYRAGWRMFRVLFRFYFGWRVTGAERVPPTGAVILAANHSSYLDPPLVGAGCSRGAYYLARSSLFRFRAMAWLLRRWNVIPVNRDAGSPAAGLKAALKALAQGKAVVLFPEGTRSRDGQLQAARSGIGFITIQSAAPVVPVRVLGTYQAFGRHRRLPRPRRVEVKYGPLIDFSHLRAEARQSDKRRLKEIYGQVADEIMAAIAAL